LATQLKRQGDAHSSASPPLAEGGSAPTSTKMSADQGAQVHQPVLLQHSTPQHSDGTNDGVDSRSSPNADPAKSPRFSCTLTLALGAALTVVGGGTYAFLSPAPYDDQFSLAPSVTGAPAVTATAPPPAAIATAPMSPTPSVSYWPVPPGFGAFDCSGPGGLGSSAAVNGWRLCWNEFASDSFAVRVADAVVANGFAEGDYEVVSRSGGAITMSCTNQVGPSSSQILYLECRGSSQQNYDVIVQMSYLG
jgi:hypothetical protein